LVVGVITLADADKSAGSPFYDRADVASVGQFAVRPTHQSAGIGGTLLRLAEERAREKGVAALGLDTSEHAARLISLYQAKGYRFIEYSQWQVTNYRSVIFGKVLS
jgi:GNAT superfamily N-acetyltransferase